MKVFYLNSFQRLFHRAYAACDEPAVFAVFDSSAGRAVIDEVIADFHSPVLFNHAQNTWNSCELA